MNLFSQNACGPDSQARMNEFLKHHLSGEGLVSLTPYDIAKIMGHQDVLQLLNNHQDTLTKNKLLLDEIQKLKLRGEYLSQIDHPESDKKMGTEAIEFAAKLEQLATQYIREKRVAEPDDDLNPLCTEFKQTLSDAYQSMSEHRARWKPLLANITIAATAIGLVLIIGKYLATGSAFFSETKRQTIINDIDVLFNNETENFPKNS